MNPRTARSLVAIIGATAAAMIFVRLAGMLFTWQVMAGPQASQFSRLAWFEMGLDIFVVTAGGILVWRLLRVERVRERRRIQREHLAEVGALASGFAHEMRNFLNAMRTHVALLSKTARSRSNECEKCEERIRRLEESTASLGELLNDFLTFARPLEDRLEDIRVGELIGEVADFVELDMEQAGVELSVEVASQVPPVYGDRAKLKRAILNLLVNARQAMVEGGTVSVRVTSEADSVTIEIADTGQGIPKEVRSRLFESFFSTKAEGAGLGLAIVKRTIDDHAGTIQLDSHVGRGTSFIITLPSSDPSRKRSRGARRRLPEDIAMAATNER